MKDSMVIVKIVELSDNADGIDEEYDFLDT